MTVIQRPLRHLLLLALMFGITTATAQDNTDRAVVAEINGEPITQIELDQLIAQQTGGNTELPAVQRRQFLEEIINLVLLAQAGEAEGLALGPDLQARINNNRRRALAQAFVRRNARADQISQDMLRERYEAQYGEGVPVEYRARHILVGEAEQAEALRALTLLDELEARGSLAFFGANESTPAILGFVRTRSLMAFASIANWPDIRRFSVAFDVTAGPVPMAPGGAVPLGGAQLVVMGNATAEERDAAFAFWSWLAEPEQLATWVEGSYYIPVRHSVVPLLDAFYAEDPGRAAALSQLELAIPRPRIPEFDAMRGILDEMMERVLRGRTSPEDALAEAQRQALAEVNR